jgi:recombination protein RecA
MNEIPKTEFADEIVELFENMPTIDTAVKSKKKQKATDAKDNSENTLNQLKKDINNRHDAKIMLSANEIVDKERKIINISPALDFGLGGGIPEGSWVLLSGTPKCGKTTLALQIAANAQQQHNKPIFIGNVEHRINKKELTGIHNLDISKIEMIQSQKGKVLMAQDFLQEFTNIVKNVPGSVLIIDSTSALCAEKEFTEDITSQARNEGPKLLATFCRKMASVVPVNDVTLIIIQHLIANTSGYGSPYYEDGGNKIQYQADIKLRCSSFQKWNLIQTDDATRVGQVVNWQIITSALGPPGAKIQSYIRYGYGVDDIKEYIGLGFDLGIISKAGKSSWCSFMYQEKEYKAQGEEKMRNLLIENPDVLEYLKTQINTNF